MQNHSIRKYYLVIAITFLITSILTSCGVNPAATATPTVEPTATAIPQKTLTVCIGDEPASLYLYGNSSQSMWSVLESIYDGPIDTVNYEPEAVILENIPTQENGGVTVQSAAVSAGDLVANTEGDVVVLEAGVEVFPEGCTSGSCAIKWDGVSELKLSQMVVKYKLLPELKWSDGQTLSADDSVYSFQVASDADTAVSKKQVKRTQSYVSLDTQTVEWTGVPGYLTADASAFFWTPLPKHLLGQYTAQQLNSANETNRSPIGWGPYMISEWISGEAIKLVKNPNYFRASEGLPYYDVVIYKFLGNIPETDISPLVNGECDIVDDSVSMTEEWMTIRSLELDGKLKGYFGQGPEWEGLNFGIKPSSYDDYYTYSDRADFFGDVRTRQAIAYCINREEIVESQIFSLGDVPDSYLTDDNPFHVDGLPIYEYNPEKGIELLEAVGWQDTDGDPSTARVARGVASVDFDTPLEITYMATDSNLHSDIAGFIKDDLQQCGITMNISLQSTDKMYESGPDGIVFGRNFDLAELGWTTGKTPPCYLYTSSEIPSEANDWRGTKYGGMNITGYNNTAYDQACEVQLTSGMDREGMIQANTEAMMILMTDLPVLPLFYDIKVMISRTDLCGIEFDTSSRSGLRTIESISNGEGCAMN